MHTCSTWRVPILKLGGSPLHRPRQKEVVDRPLGVTKRKMPNIVALALCWFSAASAGSLPFHDDFSDAAASKARWTGLSSRKTAETWNALMLQSGNGALAYTRGTLDAATSSQMGGKYVVHASFKSHPDHYTDDDGMVMLCSATGANADWKGAPGCVKFLLWDEYTSYYKMIIQPGDEPDAGALRRTQCSMVADVELQITVNSTHVKFDDNLGCSHGSNYEVASAIGASPAYLYLASDNDRGDWFAWSSVRVTMGSSERVFFKDEFDNEAFSNQMWQRLYDPTTSPPIASSVFLSRGMLRMTSQHKVMMAPAEAFTDTYFDINVVTLRNVHNARNDYPVDDDYAIFLCEKVRQRWRQG